MKNVKYFLLVFFLFSWLQPSFSQSPIQRDSIYKPYKAALSGYGGYGVLFFAAGVNAQFKIHQNSSFNHSGVWLNAGLGVSGGINHSARSVSLKIDLLSGKKNKYFELSGGVLVGSYSFQQYIQRKFRIYPDVNIGVRAQKERSPYFMRIGIGYPEYVYLSFGFSFLQ